MSNHRSLVVTVAAVLVVAGLLAPWWPVYLGQYDRYGVQIGCGRGSSVACPAPKAVGAK